MGATVDDHAFVFGGRRGYGPTYPDVCRYDVPSDTWTPRSPMPFPVMQAGVAVHAGRIYVFGGLWYHDEDNREPVFKLQTYDPATDVWTVGDMPWKPRGLTAATVEGAAFLFAREIQNQDGSVVPNTQVCRYDFASGQWHFSDFSLSSSTFVNLPCLPVLDGYAYLTEDATNGEVTSVVVKAGLPQPPWIVKPPSSQVALCGQNVAFGVGAAGPAPLEYQWFRDGFVLPGQRSPELALSGVTAADAGDYTVLVSNAFGSCQSRPAHLTVNSAAVSISLHAAVRVQGVAGATYRIEATTTLDRAVWEEVARITLSAADQVWLDPQPTTNPGRFYRVEGPCEGPVPSDMVPIPAGTFNMGGDDWYDNAAVHAVTVKSFFMDRTEVAQALWNEVYQWAIAHGYEFDNAGSAKAADHPMQAVSWYDAVKWCNARSQRQGRVCAYYTDASFTQVYMRGQINIQNGWVKWDAGFRLPTEAEWEYAARGGLEGRLFPWGDTISHSQANYYSVPARPYDVSPQDGYHPAFASGDLPHTSPVSFFPANGFGLKDMAGNVFQWCWDWYASYDSTPQIDPRGPASGSWRVIRGGSWNDDPLHCRVSNRHPNYSPERTTGVLGLRSVLPSAQP
jgi:formylglycine-generating enzyme required for sulfatase activity